MPTNDLHQVLLNYELNANGIPHLMRPPSISVKQGDRIRFKRGSVPPDNKIMIIFAEPKFFSAPRFEEGDQDVKVISDLPHLTTYECGLRGPDGQVIQKSLSGPGAGGDIQPGGVAA